MEQLYSMIILKILFYIKTDMAIFGRKCTILIILKIKYDLKKSGFDNFLSTMLLRYVFSLLCLHKHPGTKVEETMVGRIL